MEITLETLFWAVIIIGSILYLGIGTIIMLVIDLSADPKDFSFIFTGRIGGIFLWPLVMFFYIVIGNKD